MYEVIRDPLWDNIQLDQTAVELLDTPTVQRLRYVRQLGHAFLVYPGATHSRFEHALGAYHLTRRALGALEGLPEHRNQIPPDAGRAVVLAALLHDIGHYPFSHALEEAGFPSHEVLGAAKLASGPVAEVLCAAGGGPGLGEEIGRLIRGRSEGPLGGLISGTLDLDKIDYLSRDARMCGVPYGTVDVDRLLASLTLVEQDGRLQVGIQEKGVSALESLLFAKYQMYRNVYWHHAVRSATCMFKRAVRDAVRRGSVTVESIGELTDDAFMHHLIERDRNLLARALRDRRLYKRALDLPASEVTRAEAWVSDDTDLLERAEDRMAEKVGLAPGELLIDFPARSNMLAVDLPLRLRDGGVERLTSEGRAGQLGLPRIAEELYRSAQRLRVFVARPVTVDPGAVLALIAEPAAMVRSRLREE
jgi:HD superfamily phosphohydrolase